MKQYLKLTSVIAALIVAASAQAGLKSGYEVRITTSGSVTTSVGSVGKARNSADTVQFIYCYSKNNNFGYCGAKNSAGTFKACTTSDQDKIAVIRSIGVGSHVSFKTVGTSTSCDSIQVVNGSHLQPAVP